MPTAALFLDRHLETEERIVTLVTRDTGSFRGRLLRELAGVSKLPRLRLPREASLVPAALKTTVTTEAITTVGTGLQPNITPPILIAARVTAAMIMTLKKRPR